MSMLILDRELAQEIKIRRKRLGIDGHDEIWDPANNCHSHYCGGPDFLLEICTKDDRSRDKLPFYASVNTREVLIIDRDPWALELYQLQNGQLVKVGESSLAQPNVLTSSVLPVAFRLIPGENRPGIEVTQAGTGQTWIV